MLVRIWIEILIIIIKVKVIISGFNITESTYTDDIPAIVLKQCSLELAPAIAKFFLWHQFSQIPGNKLTYILSLKMVVKAIQTISDPMQ